MIKKLINQTKRALLLAGVSVWGLSMMAQSGTYGNTFVYSGAEAAIHSVNQTFSTGGGTPLDGIVGTERVSPRGFLSFVGTATWSGASDAAHVDGYAKTYMSSAFTFPIGDNGKYRPARVSLASSSSPSDAAYFRANPTSAITTSLKGGNEPVLPNSTYDVATKAADVQNVSTIEYWDINGSTSSQISLTWDATSGVAAMTGGVLAKLTIVGWDGTKWVAIPSTVDATSILGSASTTTAGSITTNANITPSSYDVYTLAVVCPNTTPPTAALANPNPICVGTSTVLTATAHATDTIRWYSNAGMTTLVGTGSPVNTSVSVSPTTSTTYYVRYENGICKTSSASVSVIVNPVPAISGVDSTNPTTCTTNNGSITLKGLLVNTTYGYNYTNAAGSSVTASGTTDASGNLVIGSLVGGSYTNITVSRLGCTSNAIASVQLTPPAPTAGTPNTTPICLGTSSQLSATGSGGTITWYSDAALTANIGTGSPLTITPTMTTKYYVAIVNGTCKSFKDSSTVSVTTNCPTFPVADTTLKGTVPSSPVVVGPKIDTPTGGTTTATITGGFYHNAGTATIDPYGQVTVTPNDTPFVGQDTLIRVVCYTLGSITKCDTSLILIDNKAPNTTIQDTTTLNTPVVLAAMPALIFEGGTPTTTTSSPKLTVTAGVPTYTPTSGFLGIDTQYVYRCDAATPANCDTTRYIITVLPSLADSTKGTTVNTPVTVGPAVTPGPGITDNSTASNGTVTVNSDGTITYTPNPNFVGTDTVKRIVCVTTTSGTTCDTQQIVINVAPSYADSTKTTPQGTPVTAGTPVLTMPGSTTAITTQGPTNGTATVNPDGTVTYTPNPNFVGRDTVKRIVCVTFADATTTCDTSLLVFVVTPKSPTILDSTAMNTGLTALGTPITTSPGTSVSTTATALHGTVTVNPDGTVDYIPNVGFVGVDTITKVVCLYDSATMTTTCNTSLIIINVYPYVKDETTTTTVNTPIASVGGPVTPGPGTTVSQTVSSPNGTTTVNPDGSLKYTPNPNYVGTDTITRIICMTNYLGTKCDTSLVIINVAPSYADTSVSTPQGTPVAAGTPVLTMPGSTTNIFTQGPSSGTISVSPTGVVTYTPNPSFVGKDTVKRIVCVTFADGSSTCDTSLIVYTISPTALPDTIIGTSMNTPVVSGPAVSGPGISVTASAKNGTTTVNPDGTVTYTPNPNYVGTDTLKKIVCVTVSGVTTCDTSIVVIHVAPNYPDTTATTPSGVPVIAGLPVLVMPGSTSSITTQGPSHGTVTVNPNGTVTYTPTPGFVGLDTVKRIVCITFANGTTKCDTSLIVFTVTAPTGTNPPGTGGTTTGTSVTTPTGTPVSVGPAIVPSAGTTVTQTATASNGTATVNADGTITYTPNAGFVGTDTIRRIVCVTYPNATTLCDTSYIIVQVTGSTLVPNYFSPNGDGSNDVWNLDAILATYPKTRASIYNRWGNIVWRSTGTYGKSTSGTNVWYGQLEGSQDQVPDGVYYYLLELMDDFKATKTGFIELMRK